MVNKSDWIGLNMTDVSSCYFSKKMNPQCRLNSGRLNKLNSFMCSECNWPPGSGWPIRVGWNTDAAEQEAVRWISGRWVAEAVAAMLLMRRTLTLERRGKTERNKVFLFSILTVLLSWRCFLGLYLFILLFYFNCFAPLMLACKWFPRFISKIEGEFEVR